MTLLVKICGLTTPEGVDAVAAAGADAAGFVFHAPSPRHLNPAAAAALAARLPPTVLRVAVTLHPTQALVDAVLVGFRPDAWQTDLADFAELDLPPEIARWPVVRPGSAQGELPARLLYEGPASGAGERADWDEARSLAAGRELILGGGLDAASVGEAVARVRPFGVDVSSGVERAPGLKDPALVHRFVAAARAAAGRMSA